VAVQSPAAAAVALPSSGMSDSDMISTSTL
jgi:hypothetical protein